MSRSCRTEAYWKTLDGRSGWWVNVTLLWSPECPFEVRFVFHARKGDTTWRVARELIEEALSVGSAGEGDIKLDIFRTEMYMSLRSPTGSADFEFELDVIERFMGDTASPVPQRLVDEAIDRLLAEVGNV